MKCFYFTDDQWVRLQEAFYSDHPNAFNYKYGVEMRLYHTWLKERWGGVIGSSQRGGFYIELQSDDDWVKLLLSI